MQVDQCNEEGALSGTMVSISYLMFLILQNGRVICLIFYDLKIFYSILGVVIYLNFETYRDTFEGPEFPRLNQNISKFQEHEEFTS